MIAGKRRTLVAATLAAAIASGPGRALAYARATTSAGLPQRWASGCVHFAVHLEALRGIRIEDALAAAAAAAETWTAANVDCTDLQIALDPAPGPGPSEGNDGINTIGARKDGWCAEGPGHAPMAPAGDVCWKDPSEVAFTKVYASARSGQIRDADIQLNALNFHWGDPSGHEAAHLVDLQAALTHEIGHALGLAHPCKDVGDPGGVDDLGQPLPDCYDAPPEMRLSVMFPQVDRRSANRELSAEDHRAICDMYPRSELAPVCPFPVRTAGGGCSTARTPARPPDGLLPTLLLLGWTGRGAIRRRGRSRRGSAR